MRRLIRFLKSERGFTLIELLAVMAIIAVLAAIIAPAVSGTKEASVDAATFQDAQRVRDAAAKFFEDQSESEVRTPHTSTTTAQLTDASAAVGGGKLPAALVSADFSVTNSTQGVSSRWPEKFITSAATSSFPAIYHEVFTTASSTESGTVRRVTLLDKTGKAQDGKVFLEGHTAVDISALKTNNLLQDDPSGSTLESSALNGAYEAPNFLWLFKKSSTGDGVSADDDSRDVVVYKLLKVDEVEVSGASTQVDLTYQRIF